MSTHSDDFSRTSTIETIRKALRIRSGRDWSVRGGRGTARGWIKIDAPPRRRVYDWKGTTVVRGYGNMSMFDRETLGRLLGFEGAVHPQGESIPASTDYRRLYLNLAIWGNACGASAEPYWD